MHVKVSALALSACVAGAMPATAAPGDQIGSALVVVNQVTAELSRDVRTLQGGDRVRHSELIEAGSDARTELKLDDETKLALGPGARLKLDKFVYDPDRTGGSILVDMVKGSFRFITGIAAKPAYLIKTPAAAVTVRGTIFDVFVRESGETWLLLSEGGVEVCNMRGKCRLHQQPGKVIRISEDGDLGAPACWSKNASALDFDEAFPFVSRPPSIDASPVFTRAVLTSDACTGAGKSRRAETKPGKPMQKASYAPKPAKQPTAKPKLTSKIVKLPPPKKIRIVSVPDHKVIVYPGIKIRIPRPRRPDYEDDDHSIKPNGMSFHHRLRRPNLGSHKPKMY